jgi:cell division protein YceG involved in septum cleavage
MISCLFRLIRYFSILIFLIFFLAACTHHSPRLNKSGKPQHEYSYQVPIKIDDGWQISSLAKEGVNKEIIADLMRSILTGKYPNIRSIVLVKNGSIVLEEYFYGNEIFKTIFAAGHGGQRVMVIPELKLVAVFTSKPDGNPKGHVRISQIMENYILPSMLASDS